MITDVLPVADTRSAAVDTHKSLGLWWRVIGLALVIYAVGLGYNFLYRGIDILSFIETFALTAGVLIGISFALSGLTYFYDFLDTKLKYRKQLGLVGYYLAVVYTVLLIAYLPDIYWPGAASTLFAFATLTGVTAMIIFTFMAIISGSWAIKLLGKNWRPLLRLGYIAYFLLILRAINLESVMWIQWFHRLDSVPPPRLLLTIFAAGVILLRIALEIKLRTAPKVQVAGPSPTSALSTGEPVPQPTITKSTTSTY